MSNPHEYEGHVATYQSAGFTPVARNKPDRKSRPSYSRRRGRNPVAYNGIHRRRRRKFSW